jgi:RecB family endonuclease NucS
MTQEEHDAAVAAFIDARGVTRCPTACAGRTQGSVAEADRLVLRRRDDEIEARHERHRQAAAHRFVIPAAFPAASPGAPAA